MKRHSRLLQTLSVIAIIGLFVMSCQEQTILTDKSDFEGIQPLNGTPIEGQYIVVFKPSENISGRKNMDYKTVQEMVKTLSGDLMIAHNMSATGVKGVFGNSITGFVANISKEEADELLTDPQIAFIEQDKIIALAPPPGKGPGSGGGDTPAPQTMPWGIARVNGGVTFTGNGIAWVIDSGIDLDHPDLNVDVSRSASFLGGKDADNPDDQNGHGTHVAGTIAAIDNSEGVIGVAAGATVVSVRVLNRRGSGTLSGVIAGVDYVAANGTQGDVANMSLGGGVSTALDNAVVAASSQVKFVLAAGNESDDADNHSPARANGNNIYTISASDVNDEFAYFSNYGNPPVDYCAPGVSIKSTWKDGGYNTISGTSMAAPHAAGVLLLGNPSTGGAVQGDPDGNADQIIVH